MDQLDCRVMLWNSSGMEVSTSAECAGKLKEAGGLLYACQDDKHPKIKTKPTNFKTD